MWGAGKYLFLIKVVFVLLTGSTFQEWYPSNKHEIDSLSKYLVCSQGKLFSYVHRLNGRRVFQFIKKKLLLFITWGSRNIVFFCLYLSLAISSKPVQYGLSSISSILFVFSHSWHSWHTARKENFYSNSELFTAYRQRVALLYNHYKAVTHFNLLQYHNVSLINEALWTANNILFTSSYHLTLNAWEVTALDYLFISVLY